ncbi:MAG: hypothetical protein HOK52_05415 [Candidatus Marinimicrobia bacterium]|jgi:hypothetical protein|nr:hypothetical protein [Candidatus Neomarinimicrobiota bacterium]MBT3936203.1 hypothetical protein [Candidatus Neomarinimicrobiota bacterium]MBT3960637.1 hypothetical protein [Candidatus Neomarinimicrobiota bacterium]MBT4384104.1 hypothetical protein [Candidatus Neomarinimicrobiota bacterium]MBT4635328.1 hypothetical protein [Candidatus Neomarinimicrobiota bacterium]
MSKHENYFRRIIERRTSKQRPFLWTVGMILLVLWLIQYLKNVALSG